jgi:hypothetical protein
MTASAPDSVRESTASTPASARAAAAILLRLVARRHVDLRRVCSALCR